MSISSTLPNICPKLLHSHKSIDAQFLRNCVSRERLKNFQHQQITISHNAPALTLHDTMEMEYTHTTTVTFIADIKETIST